MFSSWEATQCLLRGRQPNTILIFVLTHAFLVFTSFTFVFCVFILHKEEHQDRRENTSKE